jgi:hypothetical protein
MNVPAALAEQLGALAATLGVTKLTSFYHYRELLKANGDSEAALSEPAGSMRLTASRPSRHCGFARRMIGTRSMDPGAKPSATNGKRS